MADFTYVICGATRESSSLTILPHVEFHLRPMPGYTLIQPLLDALALRQWRKHRRPPAPRSVKAAVIRRFADRKLRSVFVETGTFYGDMLAALSGDFERLYSIELHKGLARRAMRRFAGDPKVSIMQGDSSDLLKPLLCSLARPAVLWLDGHYSGILTARGETDTPIMREIDAVLRAGTPQDAVLIDDARLFGTDPAYPTVAEVEQRVLEVRPNWTVRVDDDIVQMHAA
jgi:hypothetical protein